MMHARQTTITTHINNSSSSSNNNASISVVQNQLSSVALTADQTNISLVFKQKSAERRTQIEY